MKNILNNLSAQGGTGLFCYDDPDLRLWPTGGLYPDGRFDCIEDRVPIMPGGLWPTDPGGPIHSGLKPEF